MSTYGTLNADLIGNSNGQTGNGIGPGFKNRIINGDMRIAQRGTSSLTVNSTAGFYAVDRFQARGQSSDGVFTVQQVSDSPAGFEYSLKATVTTVDSSLTSGQFYYIRYMCEGYDVADLDWGTSDAKTVTLSFWVRSSLTGTFGGVIPNVDLDRSYPFTYTISSADTWEYKTITIPGDTTGTWNKTNSIGLRVIFALGAGSNIIGTAGAWAAANYQGGATGQTNVISTNGATFYITGVQLEVGSSATSFDYRPYGTELSLCQRYYYRIESENLDNAFYGSGFNYTTTGAAGVVAFPVSMRIYPTALEQSGTASDYRVWHGSNTNTDCSAVPVYSGATKTSCRVIFTVASGLTVGGGSMLRASVTGAFLAWSAEL